MLRRFSANFAVLSIFLDAALVALALWISSALRMAFSGLSFVKEIPDPVTLPIELYVLFPIVWVAVLMLFAVYDGRKHFRVADEFGSLTFAALLAAVAMAGVLYFTYRDVSRFLFLFFVLLGFVLMLSWRAIYRLAYHSRVLRAAQARRVLILGAGKIGRRLADEMTRRSPDGHIITGFLDDDPAKNENSTDVLGTLDDARAVINAKNVDDVILALPLSAHQRLNQVVSELHDLPVRVWIIPDYFSLTLHSAHVEDFAGIPMLDVRAPALSEDQRMLKRAFDLVMCALSLPITLPLMGIISLLVRLDSPGPVFYHARRMGEGGRTFFMHKFRTMQPNAEQLALQAAVLDTQGRPVYKNRSDPRVTRVGAFLRRTSLDELPQLFNVMAGDMSIVGPRPEQPFLVEKYEPWQRKRFTVPQGITGWWQINGRSDRPMHLHTEDDLYYVQHYSIWLDLQIIVRTVWSVLRGKGAY